MFIKLITLLGTAAVFLTASSEAKPLKVFILCGQSNMEGHAQTKTFPAIAKDPKTADIYKQMVDSDGEPIVCDDVWISNSYGNFSGDPVGVKQGKLTAGFGSQHHIGTGKIGPEFTFGIYMQKVANEPILLIKAAWGGKSLMVDFRPPSAGEIADEASREKAGKYYDLTIKHVKSVLADPKSVYPGYHEEDGYELSGFVWFQGFNDMVGPYPRAEGNKKVKDFSEYSRLLSCFIRDVRKDLSAPKLPFVIGVLGTGGEAADDHTKAFRASMAAPAETKEFQANVTNIFTEKYWPTELDEVSNKVYQIKRSFASESMKLKKAPEMDHEKRKKAQAKLAKKIRKKIEKDLTKEELYLLDHAISNQGYHYFGSAKFFAQIGKAFAKALWYLPQ